MLVMSAASVTMLCGCGNRFELPADVKVDQPEICERILTTVDRPNVTADSDPIAAFLEADDGLYVANERIKAGRACIADERQLYAGKEVQP